MPEPADAPRYHRLQLAIGALRLALSVALLVTVLVTGAAHALADRAAALAEPWWARVALGALALGLVHTALTFPLAWLGGYWLPRRFGLSHQPWRSWLADRLKAGVIGAVLGLGGTEVIYALLRVTDLWWLAAAAVFFVVSVLLATVLPVWIAPLFYRLTPLADEALRARLLALAQRAGVPVLGVWVADHSRKSRTANAAVVGLGRTRRIVLFDTLTSAFKPDEVEAVLAHELAHHVRGDVRRSLVMQGVLTLATFAAADVLLRAGTRWWEFQDSADPAGLPWLALILLVLGAIQTPLANAFSRRLERHADDWALATTRNPAAFIGAMERLAELNLAERRPHRLKELLLYSHPALDRRIERARREGEAA